MTRARRLPRDAWLWISAAGAFVAVTHYVGIAAGAPLSFLILDTGFAALFLVAGAIAWRRRPTSITGPLLVLSSALWSLGSWGPTQIEPIWVIGFAFEGYYDVAFAFLALTFPAGRLSTLGRVVVWGMLAAFVARSVGRLLLFDPGRTYPEFGGGGPVNPFALMTDRAAYEPVEIVANAAIAVMAAAVVVVAVRRLLRTASLTRSVIGPVLIGTTIAMLFAGFDAADTSWTTATGTPLVTVPENLDIVASWLIFGSRAAIPLAFLLGTLRYRSSGGPLGTIAERLHREADPGDVDEALSAYIEDPQLAAMLRAQLEELRASRARIVAAGDAERRRIERALHDGAQQHLTGVAMRLDELRRGGTGGDPAQTAARLDDIAAELRDAMHELRELARGIHPAILTEAGLGSALATIARRSTIPVDLSVALDGRLPLPTEVTAYYVVAEALTNVARSARAGRAGVAVEQRDGSLFIRVTDDGIGGADPSAGSGIEGLRDRVRALDGHFSLSSPAGQGTTHRGAAAVRVIVADDSAVIREGVVRILSDGGAEIIGQARSADELLALVAELEPDLAVVDIRMPPSDTAGLQAAVRIRDLYGGRVGVLVLSQFLEPEYAMLLLADGSGGVGYLLKDRVADGAELLASARRVAAGGSAIDPSVVDEIVRGRASQERIAVLTPREREVMALMAEGRSNRSVAERLAISVKTVEGQIATIFSKLGLEEDPDDNRRVLAVLAYLDGRRESASNEPMK